MNDTKVTIFGKTVDISAASIEGRRSENEDSAGWIAKTRDGTSGEILGIKKIHSNASVKDEILFCILCDGMGGLSNGKAMSSEVVSRSIEWVQKSIFEDSQEVFIGYRNFLFFLEKELMEKYPQSGTTVVILFGYKGEWHSMHIGDSRCYSITKKNIWRTKDHSPVEKLYQTGLIEEFEMNTHPMKNVISAFIGGGHSTKLELNKLQNFKKSVLCSDGAYGYMTLDQFRCLILESQCAEEIVQCAYDLESKDNISVIQVNVE